MVSYDRSEEQLVLVDEDDNITGYGEKMDVHRKEQLHRAFSLFIFNWYDHTMLIHKRADGKYHSGGLWTNACCSHPRKGEKLEDAVIRRMKDELGADLLAAPGRRQPLYSVPKELGKFQYYQKYADCAESEIDHVFYLPVNAPKVTLRPDPEEISELKWIGLADLKHWMEEKPEDFTAWFAQAFHIAEQQIEQEAAI